ncbi:hypothetical protein AKJ16_DCAP16692 [Drosera capensis]
METDDVSGVMVSSICGYATAWTDGGGYEDELGSADLLLDWGFGWLLDTSICNSSGDSRSLSLAFAHRKNEDEEELLLGAPA